MIGTLTVLGVWGAMRCIQTTIEWLMNSVGAANTAGTVAFVLLVVQVPLLFVAARLVGITAVAWVLLGGVIASSVILVMFARPRTGIGLSQHWFAIWPVAGACAGTWVAARAAHALVPSPPSLSLVATVAAGVAAYFILISAFARGSLAQAARYARDALRPQQPGTAEVPIAIVSAPTLPEEDAHV
jgi:hypothetical protein